MKLYNAEIAPNPRVEFVLVSLDQDVADAESWAKEARMPWPTLLNGNIPEEISKFSPDGFAPDYVLVNAAGEVIVHSDDEKEAFEVIKRHPSS